jgi:Flp pilus assembly protein TadG
MKIPTLSSFKKDESGSTTVEFVLWIPFIFAFILIAADATLAFMRQSQMWQVSRETARIVSRHGMNETTAEAFAQLNATIGATAPQVDVSFASGDVTVSIEMPMEALAPFGVLAFVTEDTMTTTVTHTMEPI